MVLVREGFFARNKLALILLLAGLVQVTAEVALGGIDSFPDTESYFETVEWFKGGSEEVDLLRVQRPLQILAVLPLEPLMGVEGAFAFTNCLLYLMFIPFFFSFSKKLLKNEFAAFVSTFLFQFSFCVLYWGLALLTDMLLWLMIAISFDLLFDVKDRWMTWDMVKLSLVVGIGMLNKESIIIVAFVFMFLFLKREFGAAVGRSGKWMPFVGSLALMALPFLIVQLSMLAYFGPGSTFFDFHVTHKSDDPRGELWYIPIAFLIAFNCMLLFYLYEIKRFTRENSFLDAREYIVSLALACLPILVFEQYSPRLSFLLFPFVIPVAAMLLSRMAAFGSGHKLRLALVLLFLLLYASANNAIAIYGDELRELFGIWSRS
ncbi:MAG: hypothetical protein OEM29_08990 [Thermoplasmata archaeon]|nr:hypothetical protein [Thermoplasmata archaeon]